ncbi:hypothetical protein ACS0TY_002347 [Phlomoides rotata]
MKIFNWVHRRFNNKENGESDKQQQFEDEKKCNVEVFDGWGGGILSIGTFGYDPLIGHDEEEVEVELINNNVDCGYFEELREEIGFEYMMMEKRERTTLADLFSTADHSELEVQPKGDLFLKQYKTKRIGTASFTKKLKLEEAPPIRKLNQLMRRMLKRKIHPAGEIGVLNSKVSVRKKRDINDHASLLPTPDDII